VHGAKIRRLETSRASVSVARKSVPRYGEGVIDQKKESAVSNAAESTEKASVVSDKQKQRLTQWGNLLGPGKVLEGLTHRGKWVSYMGALVSCARFLEPKVSEAWLWAQWRLQHELGRPAAGEVARGIE